MKRVSIGLAVVGLAASASALAATSTGAAPFQVTVPNLTPGFSFTATGLYAEPTSTNTDYAVTNYATSTSNGNSTNNALSSNVQSVKPDYGFGFGLGIGYIFPNSGNDVQLNWTHFDNSYSNGVSAGTTGSIVSPVFSNDNFAPFTTANAQVKFNYNAVDLDVGQYVNMGTRLQTRLFGGLRFAQLEQNFSANYSGTEADEFSADTSTMSGTINSKFTGVGPRMGIDSTYHIVNGFGVVGQVAVSALVGRVKSNASQVTNNTSTYDGINTNIRNTNIGSNNVTRVVPGVDGKLGLDYSMPFKNGSMFNIEAGYQVSYYANVFDSFAASSAGSVENIAAPYSNSTFNRVSNSFGLSGPYLSVNYKL